MVPLLSYGNHCSQSLQFRVHKNATVDTCAP